MGGLAGSGSVVGLDVGGTLMKAVVVGPEGTVTARARQPTVAGDGSAALMERVVGLLVGMRDELFARGEVLDAVGLAVPGVIDEVVGVVRFAANLGWRDVEVTSVVAHRLGVPVYLGHDVRSGALAEGVLGAARGSRISGTEGQEAASGSGTGAALTTHPATRRSKWRGKKVVMLRRIGAVLRSLSPCSEGKGRSG